MENPPFEDVFPIVNDDFPLLCDRLPEVSRLKKGFLSHTHAPIVNVWYGMTGSGFATGRLRLDFFFWIHPRSLTARP